MCSLPQNRILDVLIIIIIIIIIRTFIWRRNTELQRRLVTGESGDVRLEVNRCVFRCFLKVFRVLQCRISGGKLFEVQST